MRWQLHSATLAHILYFPVRVERSDGVWLGEVPSEWHLRRFIHSGIGLTCIDGTVSRDSHLSRPLSIHDLCLLSSWEPRGIGQRWLLDTLVHIESLTFELIQRVAPLVE